MYRIERKYTKMHILWFMVYSLWVMVYGLWFIGKETSVAVFIAFTLYTLHHTPYTIHSPFASTPYTLHHNFSAKRPIANSPIAQNNPVHHL